MDTLRKLTGKKANAKAQPSQKSSKVKGMTLGLLKKKSGNDLLSPEFETNKAGLKKLMSQYEDIIRITQTLQSASTALSASEMQFASALESQNKPSGLDPDFSLGNLLGQLSLFMGEYEISRRRILGNCGDTMKFLYEAVYKQMNEAKKESDEVLKIIGKMDAKESVMHQANTNPDSHLTLFTAHCDYRKAYHKYISKYLCASNLLTDIMGTKCYESAIPITTLYFTYSEYSHATHMKTLRLKQDVFDPIEAILDEKSKMAEELNKANSEKLSLQAKIQEKNKFDPLLEILCEGVADAVMSKFNVEMPQITDSIVASLDAYGLCMDQIKKALVKDVNHQQTPQQVMRENSYGSKITLCYLRKSCYNLMAAMAPTIVNIIESPFEYEVDPAKLEDPTLANGNVQNVIRAAENILSAIIDNHQDTPRSLREILKFLHETVEAKFPGSGPVGVVGVLFLRLLSPAIVFPIKAELVVMEDGTDLDKNAQRSLTLVSKLIQNLANGTKFKEESMEPANSFLSGNATRLAQYLENIVTVPETMVITAPLATIEEVNQTDLPAIYNLIVTNLPGICEKLEANGQRELQIKLCSILGQVI